MHIHRGFISITLVLAPVCGTAGLQNILPFSVAKILRRSGLRLEPAELWDSNCLSICDSQAGNRGLAMKKLLAAVRIRLLKM
jgi:hypothetical protein